MEAVGFRLQPEYLNPNSHSPEALTFELCALDSVAMKIISVINCVTPQPLC